MSSRLHGSSILMFLEFWPSRPPSVLNLQALGLNSELARALLGRTWPYLGASWAQPGASGAPLRVDLGLLDASWAQLGASKPHSKLNLASVRPHLSAQSRTPSSTWRLLGASWPSKPQNNLQLALQFPFQSAPDLQKVP